MNTVTKDKLNREIQKSIKFEKKSNTIFDFFINLTKKKTVQTNKKQTKAFEICIDTNGNRVKCISNKDSKIVTENGEAFSGTMKKSGPNGEKIDIKYQQGHKRKQSIGNNTVKVYTENCTKVIKKDFGTISEVKINESITNNNCKSMVYFDPEIKFARIDYENSKNSGFAGLEIRLDGQIWGIGKTEGKWHPYFIENGQEIVYNRQNVSQLYKQIKQIIKECKDNSLFIEKNPIKTIEKQIDGIYFNLMDKVK